MLAVLSSLPTRLLWTFLSMSQGAHGQEWLWGICFWVDCWVVGRHTLPWLGNAECFSKVAVPIYTLLVVTEFLCCLHPHQHLDLDMFSFEWPCGQGQWSLIFKGALPHLPLNITINTFFFLNICLLICLCWVLVVAQKIFDLCCSMWDLVPWPGIEYEPPALEVWSFSHWGTREVL